MNFFKKKATKRTFLLCLAVLLMGLLCAGYLNDFYRADTESIEAFMTVDSVEVFESQKGSLSFGPEDAETGFIFYPGGKVEYTAYLPLMKHLASEGILCVLVEMPFHLAVMDIHAADEVLGLYPQVKHWYIGGHSLGGAMAASYLSGCADQFDGLVLLGAYSTVDLSGTDLSVLAVYGSEDAVMNREKYELNKGNLPEEFVEVVIDGGCHAYFGMYGAQDGDGTPKITNEEQIRLTSEAIIALIEQQKR